MIAGSTSALVIGVLNAGPLREVRIGLIGTIAMAVVLLCSFWMLSDSMRPWLVGEGEVGPEERAHADAALRRAYTTMFVIAIGAMLYLYAAEASPVLAFDRPGDGTRILWYFVVLVFLLPIAIAAWTEPEDGFGAAQVGPLALTRSRFTGCSAPAYRIGAITLAAVIPLVMAGAVRLRGGDARWTDAVVALVLLITVAAVLIFLRELLMNDSHRRQRRER